MSAIVGVKRVIDYAQRIRVRPDKKGVEMTNVKMSMNPFDEIAVEEALRLKEKGHIKEVIAFTMGPTQSSQILLTALAMGADRGIHVVTDFELEPIHVAKALKKVVELEKPGLVMLGKQAIDGDANQTGQYLAGLLNCSIATNASIVEKDGDSYKVTREIDGGLQTLKISSPAVITADLRLNEPRFATLPNIMKAKKKPVDKKTPEELGLTLKTHVETLKVEEPPTRQAGKKLESVDELVQNLKKLGMI